MIKCFHVTWFDLEKLNSLNFTKQLNAVLTVVVVGHVYIFKEFLKLAIDTICFEIFEIFHHLIFCVHFYNKKIYMT